MPSFGTNWTLERLSQSAPTRAALSEPFMTALEQYQTWQGRRSAAPGIKNHSANPTAKRELVKERYRPSVLLIPPVSYWPELTWFIRRITLPRAETPQMWKWSRSWRKRLLSISGKLKLIRLLSSVRDHSPSLTQQFSLRRAAVSV